MQNSKIEWTTHTFNPWWGCQRVSPGCEHCYAETMAKRYGHNVWGPAKTTPRRAMSRNYWNQPLKWNRSAEQAGTRARVFCASMADVFEDHPQLDDWRADLFDLIRLTPQLDWLLLTKRPENILEMIPVPWQHGAPANVWYGTSCEDQRRADERIPHLLKVPARVRFLSCEPLLGPIDLGRATPCGYYCDESIGHIDHGFWTPGIQPGIHWVICGGESGPGARPMHPDWARSLRDQCQTTGVAFFFKQWGEWCPGEYHRGGLWDGYWKFEQGSAFHEQSHGTPEYNHWQGPPSGDYRCRTVIRPWPDVACVKLGKGWSGRSLDAKEWNELPLCQ